MNFKMTNFKKERTSHNLSESNQRNNSRLLLIILIIISILTTVLLLTNVIISILTNINLPSIDSNECLQNDESNLIYQQLIDLNLDDTIDFSTKTITYKQGDKIKLNGKFANRINYADYKSVVSKSTKSNMLTIQFNALSRAANIQLKLNTFKQDDITCDNFNWNIINNQNNPAFQEFDDCFSLDDASWYGGNEVSNQQYWPINKQDFGGYNPYLSGIFAKSSAVLERYWFSTNGISIVADYNSPLFVLKNSTNICLLGSSKQPFNAEKASKLNYTVCRIDTNTFNYMNKLHLFVINNFLSKPTGIPDETMFKRPIWSTWAVYKKFINEQKVEEFAKEINANNYTNSQLEIDDKWQTKYGDFTFDAFKFPSMKDFIQRINTLGFRTTLWVIIIIVKFYLISCIYFILNSGSSIL